MGFQFKGFMFCLMIALAASRPQYNYQSSSSSQSLTLPLNLGSNAQIMQIVPSQPLSHTYLPPQQAQPIFPPAVPAPQYAQPLQPAASGQQVFKDVSQIPLQQGHNHAFSGQSTNSYQSLAGQSSSFSGPVSNGLSGQSQGGFIGQSQGFSGGSNGQSQGFLGNSQGSLGGQSQGFVGQSSSLNQQAAFRPQPRTIVTKDIFVHTAPPDAEEEQSLGKQLESVPIRKNYRIIFIKAPTSNLNSAAQALKQAQFINEEKTVIYVLSKKADVVELQNQISQIQAPQTVNQKPEVYFIKYKTNEEAQRAQQEIQAQYDKLGGSTSISNEGIAPVVGALGSSGNLSASGSGQSASISAPVRQYLPSKV